MRNHNHWGSFGSLVAFLLGFLAGFLAGFLVGRQGWYRLKIVFNKGLKALLQAQSINLLWTSE